MALATYDYNNGKESRNQQATVWCGGLEPQCTEELVWELMCQAGPVVSVNMPRDKITQNHQGYAFCEFVDSDTADYAVRLINMIKVYGKQLRVNKAAIDQKDQPDQGFSANLFIGNLEPEVDEKMLYDTFSAFGAVLSAKVMVDPDTGASRGFGFISFDSFESADAAIESMNGQYLANRPTHVSYAYKKEGSKGERHGSESERLLAKEASGRNVKLAPIKMAQAPAAFGMGQAIGMRTAPGAPPPLPQMGMGGMQVMGMGQIPQMGMRMPPMPPSGPPGLPPTNFRPQGPTQGFPPQGGFPGGFPFPPQPGMGQMPQQGMGQMRPSMPPPQFPPNFPPWMMPGMQMQGVPGQGMPMMRPPQFPGMGFMPPAPPGGMPPAPPG